MSVDTEEVNGVSIVERAKNAKAAKVAADEQERLDRVELAKENAATTLRRELKEHLGLEATEVVVVGGDGEQFTARTTIDGVTFGVLEGSYGRRLRIFYPCPKCGRETCGAYNIDSYGERVWIDLADAVQQRDDELAARNPCYQCRAEAEEERESTTAAPSVPTKTVDAGGPAFSRAAGPEGGDFCNGHPGMSLRDYLAAHALGFIHIADAIVCHGSDGAAMESWTTIAADAYAAADSMLKARVSQ